MRIPSSRVRVRLRLSWFDMALAGTIPVFALLLRDPTLLERWSGPLSTYCIVSAVAAACFFWSFGIRDALPSYFALPDALQVVKAATCSALAATAVSFALTRLDGVPASVPVLHAILLSAALLAIRAIARIFVAEQTMTSDAPSGAQEHVILVGSNHVTSLFINLLQACSTVTTRVVAVLDDRPQLLGRSISQVRIVGACRDLGAVVDEFQVHGIKIDRVVMGGGVDVVDAGSWESLRQVCNRRGIQVDTLSDFPAVRLRPAPAHTPVAAIAPAAQPSFAHGPYVAIKRLLDIIVAAGLLVLAVPLIAIISILVITDIGAPVLFWQQRMGRNGRSFLVYKFRTLRAPYDRLGRPISEGARLSAVGQLLRTTHLDELPQLLNVLLGDMSLVGPRPLLPIDQPEDPTVRLRFNPE